MHLTLNTKDFERVKELSKYNKNYYKYIGKVANYNFTLLEICHENYNFFEYKLLEQDKEIFLGCSYDSMSDEEVAIDFKLFYT